MAIDWEHFQTQDEVQSVHIFPLKSCHEATINGQPIEEVTAGPMGLEAGSVSDREWVIADEEGLFVSQRGWDEKQARKHREDRLLATVAVDIQSDHLQVGLDEHGTIEIPLEQYPNRKTHVRIFGPELPAIDQGEEAAEFFSAFLGRAVRLYRADPDRPRLLPDKYGRPFAVNRSAAADGRPLSLASQASLNYLHDLAEMPRGTLPIARYRANVVVAGEAFGPFGEDYTTRLRLGSVGAYTVKALSRCPIPNIDQDTGDDSERLSTRLLRPRIGWAVGDNPELTKPEPFFAQSLNHVYSPDLVQVIKVDDAVTATGLSDRPNVVLKSEKE